MAIKAENLTGYFDVRTYNEKKPRDQWKIKGEDEAIAFSATMSYLPEAFKEFAKEYTDKDGNTRYRVTFKIGSRCEWFDAKGKQVEKPKNEELDGDRYEVNIYYNTLHGEPGTKQARGYWADAIQWHKVARVSFAPMAGIVASAEEPKAESTNDTENTDGPLPF